MARRAPGILRRLAITPPWVDDLAVLMWPWRVRDGIILPPVQCLRHAHRSSDPGDDDEQRHDRDTERARRDES